MQLAPVRTAAIRMAILMCLVCALDIAGALLIAKPRLWCPLIPTLIPLFTPAVIFSHRTKVKD
jgi:hypothetical protein